MVESSTFSMIVKGRYFGSFPEVTFKNHNDLHYFLLKLTERQVDFSNRWFIIQQVFLWKYRSRAFFKIYYTAAHLAAALEGQTFDFHFRFLKGPQSDILIASCCYLVKDSHRLFISDHYRKIVKIVRPSQLQLVVFIWKQLY